MNTLMRNTLSILTIGLLAGCSREINIKIGVPMPMPMTGPLAQFGKDCVNGAQTAVDELNNDHFLIDGKRAHFELVVKDDKSDPETGKQVARELVDANVNAVFGDYNSGVTIPASAIYAQAGIPQMSVSTNAKYTRQGFKTTFRITADDVLQGSTLGMLMHEKLHAKSIYLIDDATPYGVGMVEQVSAYLKAKNTVSPHDSVNVKTADLAAAVKKIKDAKTDVLFYAGDEGLGVPLLKELRKIDDNIKVVAASALCDASSVLHAGGAANENFYCTAGGVPPSWLSAGTDFDHLYTAKFGTPGSFSTLAYDGIHVFAQAMQQANSIEPAVYLPVLAKGSFDGKIQGSVEFDEKGDLKEGTIVIYQSVHGKLTEEKSLMMP